ncbi:MAG: polysaccharide biosynthesis/export family protein [Verrucomicrobiales bacterium]
MKFQDAAEPADLQVHTHAFPNSSYSVTAWASGPQQPSLPPGSSDTRFAALSYWLLEAIMARKRLVISLMLVFTIAGAFWGASFATYTATLTLGPVVPGKVSPQLFSDIAALLQSKDFSSSFAKELSHSHSPAVIAPIEGANLIQITASARLPGEAMAVANRYAQKASNFATDFEMKQKAATAERLEKEVAAAELAFREAHAKRLAFQKSSGLIDADQEITFGLEERAATRSKAAGLRIEWQANLPQIEKLEAELPQLNPELVAMREKLESALAYYTEEHPKVKALQAAVTALEERSSLSEKLPSFPRSDNPVAVSTYQHLLALRGQQAHLEVQLEGVEKRDAELGSHLLNVSSNLMISSKLKWEYESIKTNYDKLYGSLLAAKLALDATTPPFRVTSEAAPNDSTLFPFFKSAGFGAISSGFLGLFLAISLCAFCKVSNGIIRSEDDLQRATNLPVLASLGDLKTMTYGEQEQWALKALALLRGKLASPYGNAIECGFTSSRHGEGCSTWISHLSSAAVRQGYRVLLVSGASAPASEQPGDSLSMVHLQNGLTIPPPSKPVMRISLPAPSWPLQRRKDWWAAIHQFADENDAVLFVDLPPASDTESLFLAQNLKNLIWLGAQNVADMAATRSHMKNFTSINCRFVGAVLNHGYAAARHAAQKLTLFALILGMSPAFFCSALSASDSIQPGDVDSSQTNSVGYISLSEPGQMSNWQKRLVLGPGDVLNISLADEGELVSARVTIGPDGRINFRNAQNIMATGLTVDELKVALQNALLKYIRSPGVIIIPQSYASKQYYILGSVGKPGPFLLDRSVTIVEAIAHAQGFTSASRQGKSFQGADLSRSFLIRKDDEAGFSRVPVDFEALFQRGDLSQNRPLHPQDYLYFASLDFPEIYVLGEVRSPGPTAFTPETTALKAIITRGGFTDRAYKSRVLLVRGSLDNPTTLILNTSDVLAARAADFQLQPKDILYVNQKPWAKAEELLEMAISDFLRAAVITAAGREVSPLITQPIY